MPAGLCLIRQVSLQPNKSSVQNFHYLYFTITTDRMLAFAWSISPTASETTSCNNRKDSCTKRVPLINTGVWMFLWLNQSRAKLIRLLHQHVGRKRDRGRGLGGVSVMRSQPPYPHLCNAPFYIFRFPENVHAWVFANVWLYRYGTVN